MDVNPTGSNTIMQMVSNASESSSGMAAIRHQQQGFFQVSSAGNTMTANIYNANGERPEISISTSEESGFNRTI